MHMVSTVDMGHEEVIYSICGLNVQRGGIIDSHCHLGESLSKHQLSEVSDLLQQHPLPGHTSLEYMISNQAFENRWKTTSGMDQLSRDERVRFCVGLHPRFISSFSQHRISKILTHTEKLLENTKVVGFGEVGLDLSGNISTEEIQLQQRALELCLPLAAKSKLPVVIHARDQGSGEAIQRCLEIMKKTLPTSHRVHMHCFCGSMEVYNACLEAFPNTIFGITATLAAGNQKVIRQMSLHSLVLETDAPYLVPPGFPSTVRASSPNMVIEAAKAIASTKNQPLHFVCDVTTSVAKKFYLL